MYEQRGIRHASYNTGGNPPMFLRRLSSAGSSFLPLSQSRPVLLRAGCRSNACSSTRHHHLPVPPPRPPAVAPPQPPWWPAPPPPLPPSHRAPHRSHPVRASRPCPQLRERDQNVGPGGVFAATRTRGVLRPSWSAAANPLAGSVPRSGLHTSGGLLMDGADRGPPYKRRRSSEDDKRSPGANEKEREGHCTTRGDSAGRTPEGSPSKGGHHHHRPDPSVTGGQRPPPRRRDEAGVGDQLDRVWETVGKRKNSSARIKGRDKEECRDKDKDRTRDGGKNPRPPSGQKDGATSFALKNAKSDGAPRPRKSAWSQLWDSQQPPASRTHSSEQKPRGAPEPGPTPGGHKPNPWFKDGAARGSNVPDGQEQGGGPWRRPPPYAPRPTHTHPDPWFPLALQRNWNVLPASKGRPGVTPFDFTVLSYNILSQDLLRDNYYLYRHCHPALLPWEYRLPNLLAEIRHYDADILCLQEVQEDHYEKQIKPALQEIGLTLSTSKDFSHSWKASRFRKAGLNSSLVGLGNARCDYRGTGLVPVPFKLETPNGYQCEYKKRTGGKPDGCAVVFKTSRLSLLSAHPVEYLRPGIPLLDRDNVGLVVLLQPRTPRGAAQTPEDPSDFICVANTHLLFNPRRGDIKLAQLAILLAEVSRLSRLPDGSANPVVMCGDFNSVPWSPLYNFLMQGHLDYQGIPLGRVSGQEIQPNQHLQRLLTAPLWPSRLGINTHCQYNTTQQPESNTTQQPESNTTQQPESNTTQQQNVTSPAPANNTGVEGAISNLTILDEKKNRPLIPRIHHSLKLRSSYQHILGHQRGLGIVTEVTTCHTQAALTVDYIMYTPEDDPGPDSQLPCRRGLELLGRLSLVGEAELWAVNRLPNQHHSSDHLPLLTRFRLNRVTSS